MTFDRFCALLSRTALVICAVAIPLIFSPWTTEPLELSKQTLLIGLVLLALMAACVRAFAERRFVVRPSGIYVLLGIFLVTITVSAAISSSYYGGFIGSSGQEYTSVLTALVLAVYFFLGVHAFARHETRRQLWSWLCVASGVVSCAIVPTIFATDGLQAHNLIGTPNALAVFLIGVTTLGCGLWLTSANDGKRDMLPGGKFGILTRVSIVTTTVVCFFVLLAIDYWVLWLLSCIGLGATFALAFWRADKAVSVSRFVAPMLFFVCAIAFLVFPSPIQNRSFLEAAPTQSASWRIARASLSDTSVLFGGGPGTFGFAYNAFHAAEVNGSVLWDVRFDRANSYFLTLLTEIGVVGIVAYALFVGTLFALACTTLVGKGSVDEKRTIIAIGASWLVVLVAQILCAGNLSLVFLFWLLSAVLASQVLPQEKEYTFHQSPRAGLLGTFIAVLSFVLVVTVLVVTFSRYSAEVAFARAIALDVAEAPIDEVIDQLDTAALRNRWSDVYYRNLAQALMVKTAEELQRTDADPAYAQELIGASINAVRRATTLAPRNVANWELQGNIYREIAPLIGNAVDFSVAAYQEAVRLAPTNPRYHVALARAYITVADQASIVANGDDTTAAAEAAQLRTSALAQAESALTYAQKLKPDYDKAGYYLAGVYELQGRLSEAILSMQVISRQSPQDVGVAMQLGLLFIKQGKNDLAERELQRALEIAPNYANARWYLATILEGRGDLAGAIAQLEAVAAANPDNDTVTSRLNRLRQGLADSLLPPPIEEVTDDDAATRNL